MKNNNQIGGKVSLSVTGTGFFYPKRFEKGVGNWANEGKRFWENSSVNRTHTHLSCLRRTRMTSLSVWTKGIPPPPELKSRLVHQTKDAEKDFAKLGILNGVKFSRGWSGQWKYKFPGTSGKCIYKSGISSSIVQMTNPRRNCNLNGGILNVKCKPPILGRKLPKSYLTAPYGILSEKIGW